MVPGISSNSKKADCQAIFEKMLAGVSAAISGAERIVGIGGLETGLTFDYGQAVLDDEMVCLIKHMAQDIEVSNESISTDLIDEVGPFITVSACARAGLRLSTAPQNGFDFEFIKGAANFSINGNSFVKQLACQPKLLVTAISLNIFVPCEF
jgi:hypothetical protein